eukprot:CAMPEP_0169310538 /NCGR_PEP_ID=MMETSP1017-20121227/3023_1 /TAXON_ID=342587 /ORGANISM="Karlodinium micrum, Strain CCMP2283" /LENGTH=40 /DNA_ID= /DNA_START= /DNA_END= /DNA_ORIENTATION=
MSLRVRAVSGAVIDARLLPGYEYTQDRETLAGGWKDGSDP